MRLLSTLLLACLCAWAGAQTSIAPAKRVAAAKENGTSFTSYRFFAQAPQLRTNDIASACSDCDVLSINEGEVRQLQKDKPQTLTFTLPSTLRSSLEVEVVQTEVLADGFAVYTASAEGPVEFEEVLFYRGVVKGDEESMVTLTVYGDEMRALVSSPSMGNLSLGKYGEEGATYLLTPDNASDKPFECATEDTGRAYSRAEVSPRADLRSSDKCISMYLEVDNDIYRDKNGTNGVMQFVTGFFNEVATLYANENVSIKISEIFIWDTSSPYNGSDSYTLLQQFQSNRRSFNGDLAQLLSYQASGGIAYVDGICSFSDSYKLSFVSVSPFYRSVPTYSYTVMASAHEFGHLFGSQHTHACAWNGNGTALDGCPGYTEGSCAVPARPRDGGTIMSYCHITSVGINLSKGFGDQPGNLIRNSVATSSCLSTCPADGGNGDSGNGDSGNGDSGNGDSGNTCEEVSMTLTLDLFGSETTWELLDGDGNTVEEGGPYEDKNEGQQISKTWCLEDGCYTFRVSDSDNDGFCCDYGDGSLVLTGPNNQQIMNVSQFTSSSSKQFCIDTGSGDSGSGDDGNDDPACAAIDFNLNQPKSYGGTQDRGDLEKTDGGKGIKIDRNAWKSIDIDYDLTVNTMLTFEFKSSRQGEIHGIGFDDDNRISSTQTFQVWGTQRWGIPNFRNYSGNGQWKTYEIPVGQFLRGRANRLFFVADHDIGTPVGESYFRNVRLYEKGQCTSGTVEGVIPPSRADLGKSNQSAAVRVYPNPASDELNLSLQGLPKGETELTIFNLMGQMILRKELRVEQEEQILQLGIQDLPPGSYMYRIGEAGSDFSGKFNVTR
jgi:hypothetical protein